MPDKPDDTDRSLHLLGNPLSEIVGPPKVTHLAMVEEALRMASGGKADRYEEMEGHLWLNRALRFAIDALDEPFDFESHSLQKDLLEQLNETKPALEVWKMFKKANESRFHALQNLASRALTGKSYKDIQTQISKSAALKVSTLEPYLPDNAIEEMNLAGTPEKKKSTSKESMDPIDHREATLIRLATVFESEVLSSPKFRQMMDLALVSGRGTNLMAEVAKDFKNAERNKKVLGIKKSELVMATNWTNPHFPLWLASENALKDILYRKRQAERLLTFS